MALIQCYGLYYLVLGAQLRLTLGKVPYLDT